MYRSSTCGDGILRMMAVQRQAEEELSWASLLTLVAFTALFGLQLRRLSWSVLMGMGVGPVLPVVVGTQRDMVNGPLLRM